MAIAGKTSDNKIGIFLTQEEADELFNLLYCHVAGDICKSLQESLVKWCHQYTEYRFKGCGNTWNSGACIERIHG